MTKTYHSSLSVSLHLRGMLFYCCFSFRIPVAVGHLCLSAVVEVEDKQAFKSQGFGAWGARAGAQGYEITMSDMWEL